MTTDAYTDILLIFHGSSGDATSALYRRLEACGPAGVLAVNLFRACKTSGRAKQYRRRGHKHESYGRKEWSLGNAARILLDHAKTFGLTWGWGVDEKQTYHRHVLYVDLPTGQVSFHMAARGVGPDHPTGWDGVKDMAPSRVCTYAAQVLAGEHRLPEPAAFLHDIAEAHAAAIENERLGG